DRWGRRQVALVFILGQVGWTLAYYSVSGPLLVAWVGRIFMAVGANVTLSAFGVARFPTSSRSTAAGMRLVFLTLGGSLGLLLESLLYGVVASHCRLPLRIAEVRQGQTPPAPTPLPGHLCEQCLDAPAVLVVPAPGGGDMGICAACQQAAAIATLPVLTAAAGQQTLWHPIRDPDRLAGDRGAGGGLPAWWDRCGATAPARICPCGSYQLRWGEDEVT